MRSSDRGLRRHIPLANNVTLIQDLTQAMQRTAKESQESEVTDVDSVLLYV